MQNKLHFRGGCVTAETAQNVRSDVPPATSEHAASEAAVRGSLGAVFDKLLHYEQLLLIETYHLCLFNADAYREVNQLLDEIRERYENAGILASKILERGPNDYKTHAFNATIADIGRGETKLKERWGNAPDLDELAFLTEDDIEKLAKKEAEANRADWRFFNETIKRASIFAGTSYDPFGEWEANFYALKQSLSADKPWPDELKNRPLPDDAIVIRALGTTLAELPGDSAHTKTLRALDPKFIRRRLRRHVRRANEAAGLWLGIVGKNGMQYCTNHTLKSREDIDAAAAEWASRRHIKSESAMFSLNKVIEKAEAGRVAERHVLNQYICNFAKSHGWEGFFITATCPPHMHPNPGNGVCSWDGTMPDEAAAWMQKQFARVRAMIAKKSKKVIGSWTKEPHKDATPHFHLAIFFDPKAKNLRRQVVRAFVRHFRHNKKALVIKQVDWSRGNPANYLFKYIQKSAGVAPTGDDPSNFARVRAAQKAWRWRTYGYFGLKSTIFLWRMCRKIDGKEAKVSKAIAQMCAAAKGNDWGSFLAAIPRSKKGVALVKLYRTPSVNEYGDKCWKLAGVADMSGLEPKIAEKPEGRHKLSGPQKSDEKQMVTVVLSDPRGEDKEQEKAEEKAPEKPVFTPPKAPEAPKKARKWQKNGKEWSRFWRGARLDETSLALVNPYLHIVDEDARNVLIYSPFPVKEPLLKTLEKHESRRITFTEKAPAHAF